MAVTTNFFNKFLENVGKGEINLVSDTFKAILVNGYMYDATDENLADIGAVEIAGGNGYTAGGQALAGKVFTFGSGATKWDADDVSWAVSGGSVGPMTGAVIYDDTAVNNKLVCYVDFGQTETALTGSDFKLVFNSNGILTIS